MVTDRDQRLRALEAARLYFVCEGLPLGGDPDLLLDAALRGGADMVQLREKSPRSAGKLIALADPFGARRPSTERPSSSTTARSSWRPVGPTGSTWARTTCVAEARRLAGPEALIGLSTHSREGIQAACAATGADRPDQISVGPVWATPTKEGRPGTGLELIEYAAAEATIPWFAIGGIDTENVSSVAAAGASRVVVVRAIRDAQDPAAAARRLREALEARVGVSS